MPPFESHEQVIADLDVQSVIDRPQAQVPADDGYLSGGSGAESAEKVLAYLGQVTACSASGLLLAEGQRLQLVLYRSRHVDDFFLSSMQQRLLSSYRVYAGAAIAPPEPNVTVYDQALLSPVSPSAGQVSSTGQVVAGPYEPLRSLLVVPVLDHGHVIGMLSIASVSVEAFDSEDLCSLSVVAAQLPLFLDGAADGDVTLRAEACLVEGEACVHERELRSRVQNHATSICGLARLWQMQDDSSLPEVLRKDLDAIAESALQIRELVT